MELARRGAELAKYFASSKVKKIVHLTHYLYNPKVGADNLRALGPDLLVAENDLKANSKYFNRYFGDVAGAFYQLPYVAGARFDRRCTFGERVNKLGVTGSITYKLQDSEFTNFFGQGELQPMRRMLFEQRASIADQVDCLIYDLDESRRMLAEAELSGDTGKDVHAKINALQRAYYNTDIVEFFNRYTMFSVPEEICDLPGIGFIEGMACGTAYFGIDDPMYRAIGMIPGINYVAYDGTVSGLLEKITYYQVHSEELENIANLGYQFAHEAMSKNEVYLAMLARIEELIRGK
jgi:hypothetical protein